MTGTPTARYSGKQSSSEAFAGHSTIYGRGGDLDRPYLTRLWFGRLRLHIFFKGDQDPDPHDHPWDFWTLPLVAYEEEVLGPDHMTLTRQIVPAWRISFRTANHTHRVLGPRPGPIARWLRLPLITIVWRGRTWRKWGFWPRKAGYPIVRAWYVREWTPWDQYLANKDGGAG